jgi:hypothetical protein
MKDFETFDDFQDAIEDWAFERGPIEQSTVEAQLLKLVEEAAELIEANPQARQSRSVGRHRRLPDRIVGDRN